MTTWQRSLVESLRGHVGTDAVRPYGSFESGALDVWSDLDVELDLRPDLDVVHDGTADPTALFGAAPWAWQVHDDGRTQTARLVLLDGRRVDARVRGVRLALPAPSPTEAARFDAALALVRIGRGNRLIGLHLLLGVLREALVLGMRRADRDTGTDHHRSGTPHDDFAERVADVARGPVDTSMPFAACALYDEAATALDPDHVSDDTGLRAVADLACLDVLRD